MELASRVAGLAFCDIAGHRELSVVVSLDRNALLWENLRGTVDFFHQDHRFLPSNEIAVRGIRPCSSEKDHFTFNSVGNKVCASRIGEGTVRPGKLEGRPATACIHQRLSTEY